MAVAAISASIGVGEDSGAKAVSISWRSPNWDSRGSTAWGGHIGGGQIRLVCLHMGGMTRLFTRGWGADTTRRFTLLTTSSSEALQQNMCTAAAL
jgi:hypothetical protein